VPRVTIPRATLLRPSLDGGHQGCSDPEVSQGSDDDQLLHVDVSPRSEGSRLVGVQFESVVDESGDRAVVDRHEDDSIAFPESGLITALHCASIRDMPNRRFSSRDLRIKVGDCIGFIDASLTDDYVIG
jgi:hypothetical protein